MGGCCVSGLRGHRPAARVSPAAGDTDLGIQVPHDVAGLAGDEPDELGKLQRLLLCHVRVLPQDVALPVHDHESERA